MAEFLPQVQTGPRDVLIEKGDAGFGFNVRGQVSAGGQLKSINGVLYPPLQHVSMVMHQGAADVAGVRKGDRIIAVNGVDVQGAEHRHVVDLIKGGGPKLTLTLISVTRQTHERLEPSDENLSTVGYHGDYGDIKYVPISIPSFELVVTPGERYYIFKIYYDDKYICSRRYSEFVDLHNALKTEFCDYKFPKLPGKWPFQMNENQIEQRRRGLESYLQKTICERVIAEFEVMQDFVALESSSSVDDVPMQTKPTLQPRTQTIDYAQPLNGLSDHQRHESPSLSVPVNEPPPKPKQTQQPKIAVLTNLPGELSKVEVAHDDCNDIEQLISFTLNYLKIPTQKLLSCFGIFFLHETDSNAKFYLRLPNNMEMNSLKRKAADQLYLRKAVFSRKLEKNLSDEHPTFSNFIFHQAKADLKAGIIPVEAEDLRQKLTENFKSKNVSETIDTLHTIPSYNTVTFPHCGSNVQKENLIKMSIDEKAVYLRVCDQNGVNLDFECVTCTWETITSWTVENEHGVFSFDFTRPNGKVKSIKLHSDLAEQMSSCFDEVSSERKQIIIS